MTDYVLAPEMVQRFAGSLLHFIWQGAAIALLTSACLRLFRGRSAEVRYAVSVGALIAMILAPVLTFIFYKETGALALHLLQFTGKTLTDAAPETSIGQAAATLAWTQWVLATWSIGVLVFTARLVAGWQVSRRLVTDSQTIIAQSVLQTFAELKQQLELIRPIQLLSNVQIDTPMVVGCLRPALLLPLSALTGLNEDQLAAILAHELAHIRRHDFLINILQRCVESVLFYHPGVWWLSSRIRAEREHCCDDVAIRVCGDRRIYVQALIELERQRQGVPVLSVAATGGSMVQRVHRILGIRTSNSDWQSAAATLACVLVWLFVGAWQSSNTLQAKPILVPAIGPAAAVLPAIGLPMPVAESVTAITAIITAQPIAEPQNVTPVPSATGTIQGIVTRAGTSDPISDATITVSIAPAAGLLDAAVTSLTSRGISYDNLLSRLNELLTLRPQELQAAVNRLDAQSEPPEVLRLLRETQAARERVPGFPVTTLTNGSGQFVMSGLPPGRYVVTARRDGFFGIVGNSKNRFTNYVSMLADVTVQQPATTIAMVLTAGGLISGRVSDIQGRARSNTNVQAFTVEYQAGLPVLRAVATKVTDDRGEYRLFWLQPGEYYIGAVPRDTSTPSAATGSTQIYVKSLHPNATDLSSATPIKVNIGEEIGGIDVRLRTLNPVKISGQVINTLPSPGPNPDGRQPAALSATLMLLRRDSSMPDDTTARAVGTVSMNSAAGTFDVPSILTGAYDLYARIADQRGSPGPGGGGVFAWGRAAVDVAGRDIDGVTITILPSMDVKGFITVNGKPAGADYNAIRIALRPDGTTAKIPQYQGVVNRAQIPKADGSFAIPLVAAGDYRVQISGLPFDAYIADVKQAGVSVYDSGIVVNEKTREGAPIEVAIGNGAGAVEGTVLAADKKAVPFATVVLAPSSEHRRNMSLYKMVTTNALGHFVITGIGPGEYRIFSWNSIPAGAEQSGDFVGRHEAMGVPVRVGTASTTRVDIPLILSIGPQ